MNLNNCFLTPLFRILYLFAAVITAGLVDAPSASAEKIYSFEDQHIQIEARTVSGESRTAFRVEIGLTPKAGWKLLANNSSSTNPLKLKYTPGKCLQLKGALQQSTPDWSGTDDSGVYSEYFTKAAVIRQEFTRGKCADKKGLAATAALSYLLCQDNRCLGPFIREFRFTAPAGN